MTFWFNTDHGPRHDAREIDVADWPTISENYAETTRGALDDLIARDPEANDGHLFLWHGPPGTGKTWAIRALAWEWRGWCDFHYVTDPELLFSTPGYLAEVMLDARRRHPRNGLEHRERWRLLVLEDTGEMLEPDAKVRVGQGLARLLNVADGLLGQGLPVLVLVTSNEPLDRIHPAVARPGRCAGRVEFEPLTEDEATRWLCEHGVAGVADRLRGPTTIAELHALLRGGLVPTVRTVGFRSSTNRRPG